MRRRRVHATIVYDSRPGEPVTLYDDCRVTMWCRRDRGEDVVRGWCAHLERAGLRAIIAQRGDALAVFRAQPAAIGQPRPTTPRQCLCCGATFESEGPHNRMCDPCRDWSKSVIIMDVIPLPRKEARR